MVWRMKIHRTRDSFYHYLLLFPNIYSGICFFWNFWTNVHIGLKSRIFIINLPYVRIFHLQCTMSRLNYRSWMSFGVRFISKVCCYCWWERHALAPFYSPFEPFVLSGHIPVGTSKYYGLAVHCHFSDKGARDPWPYIFTTRGLQYIYIYII